MSAKRHEWLIPVWILWRETLISRFQEYFFSCSFFISFLSDILVPVNSVTDTDKKLSAGLGVVNPARLKQLRLFTYTNCFFTKHLSSFRRKNYFALIWHEGDIFYFSLNFTEFKKKWVVLRRAISPPNWAFGAKSRFLKTPLINPNW